MRAAPPPDTLNYNFQSPYYGVHSSNRPNLALPYFVQLKEAVALGRRRAQKKTWSTGTLGAPGLEEDDFCGSRPAACAAWHGGYGGIELPGHIGPYGLHDWTDRGQRSNAALSATVFIDHAEYTQNKTFISAEAYPFLIEVLAFFET